MTEGVTMTRAAPEDLQGDWAAAVRTDTGDLVGRSARIGYFTLIVFVAWSVLFPLDSAIVGEGALIAKGQNKVLQHRAGGVITEILAREGDLVRAGQTVLKLDPAQDRAELTRLRGRLALLQAMHHRLDAEKQFAASPDGQLPEGFRIGQVLAQRQSDSALTTGSTPKGKQLTSEMRLLIEQQREFEKGRGALQAEIDALTNRADALARRKKGYDERYAKLSAQTNLLSKQHATMKSLVGKGYIALKSVWDIEEQLLGRQAELANLDAEREAVEKEIKETGARINMARLSDQRQASTRMTDVIAEMAQISDQLQAAERTLSLTDVRASVDGVLMHNKHVTVGGVATPGEVLAHIVPLGTELAFRARVLPTDISHVRVGQATRTKITSLSARLYDEIPGEVTFVAADATTDDKTGIKFFEVEIRFTTLPKDPAGKPVLMAGMLGQTHIVGESRTFASYLLAPLRDSLSRSFREH
ncbi:AcrA Membrane-fusion protein [Rhabdaerophilaceae bacterium]